MAMIDVFPIDNNFATVTPRRRKQGTQMILNEPDSKGKRLSSATHPGVRRHLGFHCFILFACMAKRCRHSIYCLSWFFLIFMEDRAHNFSSNCKFYHVLTHTLLTRQEKKTVREISSSEYLRVVTFEFNKILMDIQNMPAITLSQGAN